MRVFSGPSPFNSSFGAVTINAPISGSGSLVIGGGFSQSSVQLNSASSTFTGGVMITEGTLGIGASSMPIPETSGSGPLGFGSLNIAGSNTSPTLVALNSAQSINNVVFLNSDLNIGAGNALTFNNTMSLGSAERVINVGTTTLTVGGAISGSGALSKDGPGTMILSSSNSYTGPTSVWNGTLQFNASQNLLALNIGDTSRAILSSGGDKVLRTAALRIATGGTLDLTDEDAILDYSGASPLPRITQLLTAGYNVGSWNGAGITSASAQSVAADNLNPHKTAIGFGEASALGLSSFDGQSVDPTTILFRYTLAGDANIDGNVNALDFNALASSYSLSGKSWINGDFDYNGVVNSLDFNAIAINFNSALPSSPLGTLVPEPLSVGFTALLLLAQRRRERRIITTFS